MIIGDMILPKTNNLREYEVILIYTDLLIMSDPETTTVSCIGCDKEITELVINGKPLNRFCRTCAATQ